MMAHEASTALTGFYF